MTLVIAGTIGRSGLGGQAWAVLQYLLGFRTLGHDVYYLEDCGISSWVYDWDRNEWTTELDYPAAYVRACLEPFGFAGKWVYRTNDGAIGMTLDQLKSILASADLLVMRAVPLWVWREEYNEPKRRVFIDVDPGFTQISIAQGDKGIADGVARCERRFSVGQRIGAPDCPIPTEAGPWMATLPPVFLGEWPNQTATADEFTSIIRWQGFREAEHQGAAYGQRDKEFPIFFDLPKRTGHKFRVAMMGTKPETLTTHGWAVAPGEIISKTPASYRDFIQKSRGEFCVPKHGYVATRGGWISDRSVCYLASGRPVLMEETGISECIPRGEGLVTFHDFDSACAAIRAVNADYGRHSRAARQLAESVFDSVRVLPRFLDAAMS
jgi:hypothetical protein